MLAGLGAGARFNVDGRYVGTGVSLGHHQGYQARARADIENTPAGRAGPCTQQNAVRAHFHGAHVVLDHKLLECKTILHKCCSNLLSYKGNHFLCNRQRFDRYHCSQIIANRFCRHDAPS